ncbi:ATP-grasp domain-containing protein [Furfurilactobacillus sp. WILCCON 0119]|uniref:ATP-grasp domain-containing protein n=1 Tax=Furfurilactobacillus entadae TaxID=2922307 RepID=UPI0035EE5AE3
MAGNVLYPGNTIGIIGNSSNGPLLVNAARRVGLTVAAYTSEGDSEIASLADVVFVGSFTDQQRLQAFAENCDVVTYESEHVPSDMIEFISQFTRVPQNYETLAMMQDRSLERAFFEELNINIPPYATIVELDDIYASAASIGYPAVLKPLQKGIEREQQLTIRSQAEVPLAADMLQNGPHILEAMVPHTQEVSVLVVKGDSKEQGSGAHIRLFPIIETSYQRGRLMRAVAPARLADEVETEIKRITEGIAQHLNYCGVFQVSFLITETGNLFLRDLVPAMDRSGLVFDKAANINMFEAHLHAVAGLPIAEPVQYTATVLASFDDDQLEAIRTQWIIKSNWEFVFYHRSGRKISPAAGHVLIQAPTVQDGLNQLSATTIWDPRRPVQPTPSRSERNGAL